MPLSFLVVDPMTPPKVPTSFEAQYRPCMAELGTGDALLNVTLPAILIHPALLAAIVATLGQVYETGPSLRELDSVLFGSLDIIHLA